MKAQGPYMETRQTLLQRLSKQQDDASWQEFVDVYQQFIYNVCRKTGLNHHDSEEVGQKVLLRLWKKLPEFEYDHRKKFRGFLCKVTGGLIKDYFRASQRYQKRCEKLGAGWLGAEDGFGVELEDLAEKEWKSYLANLALENLEQKITGKAVAVFRRLLAGVQAQKVAQEFEITANLVAVYKKRVKAKMHEEIRRLSDEFQ